MRPNLNPTCSLKLDHGAVLGQAALQGLHAAWADVVAVEAGGLVGSGLGVGNVGGRWGGAKQRTRLCAATSSPPGPGPAPRRRRRQSCCCRGCGGEGDGLAGEVSESAEKKGGIDAKDAPTSFEFTADGRPCPRHARKDRHDRAGLDHPGQRRSPDVANLVGVQPGNG